MLLGKNADKIGSPQAVPMAPAAMMAGTALGDSLVTDTTKTKNPEQLKAAPGLLKSLRWQETSSPPSSLSDLAQDSR